MLKVSTSSIGLSTLWMTIMKIILSNSLERRIIIVTDFRSSLGMVISIKGLVHPIIITIMVTILKKISNNSWSNLLLISIRASIIIITQGVTNEISWPTNPKHKLISFKHKTKRIKTTKSHLKKNKSYKPFSKNIIFSHIS